MLKSKGLCLPKIPPSPQCFLGCSRRPVVKSQRASSTTIPLVVTNQNESDPNQTVIKSNKPALVVNFLVPYVTRPGQEVLVAGENQELGGWLQEHALRLEWADHFWHASISLPYTAGPHISFKVLLQDGHSTVWEPGPNRCLDVAYLIKEGDSKGGTVLQSVICRWGQPSSLLPQLHLLEPINQQALNARGGLDGNGAAFSSNGTPRAQATNEATIDDKALSETMKMSDVRAAGKLKVAEARMAQQQAEQEARQAEARLQDLSSQLAAAQAMAEQDALDAEQRLQAVRQQAEEGQTQSVQEVKRLLAEVEKGQQQAAEVHVLLQQAQDLGAIQAEELLQLRNELKSAQDSAHAKAEEKDTTIKELDGRVAQVQTALYQANQQQIGLEETHLQELKSVTQQLTKSSHEVAKLRAQLEVSTDKAYQADQQRAQDVERLNASLAREVEEGVRLRSKLRTGEREVEGLKAQILRTQPEVVQLQDQMQGMHNLLAKRDQEVQSLLQKVEDMESATDDIKSSIAAGLGIAMTRRNSRLPAASSSSRPVLPAQQQSGSTPGQGDEGDSAMDAGSLNNVVSAELLSHSAVERDKVGLPN